MAELIPSDVLEQAYANQKKLVTEVIKTKGIAGYKAAVSGKGGQKNMGLSTLLAGVLYQDGNLENNSTIELSDFKLAKIETEIGYRLAQDVSELTSVENVQSFIAELLPVFEVPDVTSEDPANITVPELIGSNTFSSHQVLGDAVPVGSVDPNTIVAELFHNNTAINTGKGTDAMDNQWEALSVAINFAIEHGYSPKKGDIVITGALGQIHAIEKGTYTADYGKLGKLKLEVK